MKTSTILWTVGIAGVGYLAYRSLRSSSSTPDPVQAVSDGARSVWGQVAGIAKRIADGVGAAGKAPPSATENPGAGASPTPSTSSSAVTPDPVPWAPYLYQSQTPKRRQLAALRATRQAGVGR